MLPQKASKVKEEPTTPKTGEDGSPAAASSASTATPTSAASIKKLTLQAAKEARERANKLAKEAREKSAAEARAKVKAVAQAREAEKKEAAEAREAKERTTKEKEDIQSKAEAAAKSALAEARQKSKINAAKVKKEAADAVDAVASEVGGAEAVLLSGLSTAASDPSAKRGAAKGKAKAKPKAKVVAKPVAKEDEVKVHPRTKFGKTAESLVDLLARDVDWGVEVNNTLGQRHGEGVRRLIDHMKSNPISQEPGVDALWERLWGDSGDVVFDKALRALAADIAVLEESLKENEGNNDTIMETAGDMNSTLQRLEEMEAEDAEAFWNVADTCTAIFTDSEEETVGAELRHSPYARPLRSVIRRLRKSEQRLTIFARTIDLFQTTMDDAAIWNDNVKTIRGQFLPESQKEDRRKRAIWREWRYAGRFGAWASAWQDQYFTQLEGVPAEGDPTPPRAAEWNHFHVLNTKPHLRLIHPFVKTIIRHHKMQEPKRDADNQWKECADSKTFYDWVSSLSALTYRHPPSEVCETDSSEFSDYPPLLTKSAPLGTRFYMGRVSQIWGRPFGEAYSRTFFAVEVIPYLRQLYGPLKCLYPLDRVTVAKDRFRTLGNLVAQDREQDEDDPDTSLLVDTALLALPDGGAAGGYGAPARTVAMEDSEVSEGERKADEDATSREVKILENPHREALSTSGFGLEVAVARIGGGQGRFRNSWDVKRRRRLGLELVKKYRAGPLRPHFSSSEESEAVYQDKQSTYRAALRESLKWSRQMRMHPTESQRRVMKGMLGMYPFEQRTVFSEGRSDWPGSPLDKYEDRLRNAAVGTDGDEVEEAANLAKKYCLEPTAAIHYRTKRRVRGIESRFDCDPRSKNPLGFMAQGKDHAGREFELSAVDTSELSRRFGNAKAFSQGLGSYANRLKKNREYYVVINEETNEATVFAGSDCQLMFCHTAKENHRRFMWKSFWDGFLTGRIQRRLTDKALRYEKFIKGQGAHVFQDEVDQYNKVSDRMIELQPFTKAKYLRGRTHAFSHRRELDRLACPDFAMIAAEADVALFNSVPECSPEHAQAADNSSGNPLRPRRSKQTDKFYLEDFSDSDEDLNPEEVIACNLPEDSVVPGEPYSTDTNDSLDAHGAQPVLGPVIPDSLEQLRAHEDLAVSNKKAVEGHLRMYNYGKYLARAFAYCPQWSWSWDDPGAKLRRRVELRYRDILPRYLTITNKRFIGKYRLARKMAWDRSRYELEYSRMRRTNAAKTLTEEGRVATAAKVSAQQLADAIGAIADPNEAKADEDESREEVLMRKREATILDMRRNLPPFNPDTDVAEDVYRIDDVVSAALRVDAPMSPEPVLQYFKHGCPDGLGKEKGWNLTTVACISAIRGMQIAGTVDVEDVQMAKDVKILNWLISLYPLHRASVPSAANLVSMCTRNGMENVPTEFAEWALESFYQVDETGRNFVPENLECKWMSSILWMVLRFSGRWKFDFKILLEDDWGNKHNSKFMRHAPYMGLRKVTSATPWVYELVAPMDISSAAPSDDKASSAGVFLAEAAAAEAKRRGRGRGGRGGRGRGG